MSQTSFQYQVPKQGSALTKASIPRPTPGPNEICIRTKAVALNPLDWKRRAFGFMDKTWPAVLGMDAAGVVDSVGDEIKDFKTGDEVLCLCDTNTRAAAFQEIITLPLKSVGKKPKALSFEEAASVPLCYLTAVSAITFGLHVSMPFLDTTVSGSSSLRSILVLGGSSNIGAEALQLLRLALPSALILTTSSTKHHSHLLSLGASKCFDRSAQEDTSAIKAATPGGTGVDAILDPIQAAASQASIFTAFKSTGPKIYSQIMTGATVQVPEGVNSTLIEGRQIHKVPGGANAIPALTGLIESGKLKVPTRVEVVGKGMEGIELGLEMLMKKGASGVKYVVSM